MTWWPLQTLNIKQLATDVGATVRKMDQVFAARPPGLPTACPDSDVMNEYLTACRKAGLRDTSTLYVDSRRQMEVSREEINLIGIDVTFPSGSYSFINGVYLPQNAVLVDLIDKYKNEYGLFRNFDDATQFMAIYSSFEGPLGLEPLDDAIPLSLGVLPSDL